MSEEKNTQGSDKPAESLQSTTDSQQPETRNEKQETNMEVHKHPHAVTHKKKWSEYFLEFLMIFLAVFLGFIAENVRERLVEKKRGQEYIHSLYEDLEYDISRIDGVINIETVKIAALNKMKSCYDSINQKWTSTSCMADLVKYSRSNNPFQITNRTLNQLANAGGFRLLKAQDADSIVSYQNSASDLHDYEATLYQQAQDNIRNTSMELFEFRANTELYKNIFDPGAFNSNVNTPLLLSDNKELINKYFNQLLQYLRASLAHRLLLVGLKDHAARIVDYFNRNYHLE
jgi:hypothetical protein